MEETHARQHSMALKALLLCLIALVFISADLVFLTGGTNSTMTLLRWSSALASYTAVAAMLTAVVALFVDKAKKLAVVALFVAYCMLGTAFFLKSGDPEVRRSGPPVLINP